ncbi:hypothetical protein [uncultured Sphingomonas sp.]|uniref:hypothetical protein n=1 Tax=uncultured Sphingomonas sp. TaxID=158754 RepID=UPI0035CA41C5
MNEDKEKKSGSWRKNLAIIFGTLVYMLPLFWLWQKTGYPESLGFRITARGKGGLIENWWYSYRLIERHNIWDVVAFVYMWAAVVGIVAWLVWAVVNGRRAAAQEKGAAA